MASAARVIEMMRDALYAQSVMHTLAVGWDKVAEVRLSPFDYEDLMKQVPAYDAHGEPLGIITQGSTVFSVRIVVDKYLRRGECIPLDAQGNVICIPTHLGSPHKRKGEST